MIYVQISFYNALRLEIAKNGAASTLHLCSEKLKMEWTLFKFYKYMAERNKVVWDMEHTSACKRGLII